MFDDDNYLYNDDDEFKPTKCWQVDELIVNERMKKKNIDPIILNEKKIVLVKS